jgi:predicted permease
MLQILESISPVFVVIALGFISRKLGFLPDSFIQSANRLVYFVAIPILVFSAISGGSFADSFDPSQIGGTFLAATVIVTLGLLLSFILRITPAGTATFVQSSFHGNLGYVGLAVVFYALGPEGRGAASVLAGFLILYQNTASILLYTFTVGGKKRPDAALLMRFLGNPIILATLVGLFFSATGLSLPGFINRSFDIVSHMALPLALLIIGGSLRAASARRIQLVAISTTLKLLILPLAGFLIFKALGISASRAETALILLASPSATISYIMAMELGGREELAAAAVTISTVLSIFTYTFWIAMAGYFA